MHEHTYVNHLVRHIDLVMGEYPLRRVTGITVRLGALSLLSPENLQQNLELAIQERLGEGADIRVIVDSDTESPDAMDAVVESIDFLLEPETYDETGEDAGFEQETQTVVYAAAALRAEQNEDAAQKESSRTKDMREDVKKKSPEGGLA